MELEQVYASFAIISVTLMAAFINLHSARSPLLRITSFAVVLLGTIMALAYVAWAIFA